MNYKFTSIIWNEEGGYVSNCPELGISSAGDTIEEAFNNLKEAIELYLENAKELGLIEDIKKFRGDSEKFTAPIEISVK